MASYHLSVKIISRSSGRSAVASASYRSRAVMNDERQGMTFDYSKKQDLAYSAIMLPENAPKAYRDREVLWNAVEKAEKRADAQVSREIEIALPYELSLEKQVSLVREFVSESFVSKGMIADVNIHNKEGNPHAHIMLTMRSVSEDGFGGKVREWNKRDLILEWRQDWANIQNEYLSKDGHAVRVDHKSFEDMGIALDPQVKVGVGEHAYGENGDRVLDLIKILSNNGDAIIENPNIALDYLTKNNSTFTNYDLYKFANAHSYQEPQFRQVVEAVLSSNEIVQLEDEKYSTVSILKTEKEMLEGVAALQQNNKHAVSNVYAKQAIAYKTFGEDQVAAFTHSVNSNGISVVIGHAGTGKSYVLGAVKEAYESDGYIVSGIALAGIAAKNLQESSGVNSTTIYRKLKNWENGIDRLDKNHVLIVDEAGMVGTNQMAHIVKHVNESGAKLILVGDDQQLQAIGAGGPLRCIKEEVGFVSLTDVRRQTEQWQRDATVLLAGDKEQIGKAVDLYSSHGNVHQAQNIDESKQALLHKFCSDYNTDESRLILAHRNKDVLDLNSGARTLLRNNGYLQSPDTPFESSKGSISLVQNDRVVFLEGNNRLGVYNGTLGTVRSNKNGVLRVGVDAGKEIVFNSDDYNKIGHGYAVTIHKSQGATVDKIFVLATPGFDKHLGYVSMSRHRDSANLFYSNDSDGFKNIDHLKASLGRDNSKDLAIDYLPADISYHDSKRRAVSDTIDIMMLKTGRVDQALDPKEANKNGMLLIQYPEIGLKLLSHHNAIFTERDIDLFVHNNSQGIEQFNGAKSAIMNSKELTRLGDENFTTRSLVEAEKQLFVDIGELHKKNTLIVSQESVEGTLSTRKLGGDQLEAFNSIVQNDSNLAVVHGVAGTGKSYMLGAVRNAFENDGVRVVGVALSGVAARSLQDGSGIESSTIHSKLLDWQKGRGLMDKKHVLVVDEAGMVGTNQMAQIVKHVNESGAKLILVGDDQQLQAVGAGGPLKGIKEEVGFVSLTDVRRQTEQWQREATVLLAGNKEQIGKAIDLYSSHGNVHQAQNIDEAKSLLLKDWAIGVESDGKSRLILTHKNEDVLAINLQAREILKEKGVIGSDDFQFLTSDDKVINLADKERVVFTKNDISMGVENGTLGTVTGIKNNTLHVHLDNGKNIEFDEKKYNDLSHGYAVTTHKSQGVTVDKSYVLASPTFDKHLGYVSLTRHRDDTNLYYSLDHFKDEDHLKDTLGRKREKDLIRDFDNSPGDHVGKTEGVVKDNRPEKSINSKDRHFVVSDDSGRILNTNGNFKDDAANHTFDKPSTALDVAYQKRGEHSKELEGTALYVHRVEQGEIIGKPFLKTVDSPDALKTLWSRQMGVNNPVPDNLIKQAGPVSLEISDQKFKISLYEDVNKPFATATVSIPDGLDKEQTKKALNNEIRSLSDSTPGFDMDKTRVKVESVNPVEIAKTKEKSISDDRELSL